MEWRRFETLEEEIPVQTAKFWLMLWEGRLNRGIHETPRWPLQFRKAD
jgi:hypothetical protein